MYQYRIPTISGNSGDTADDEIVRAREFRRRWIAEHHLVNETVAGIISDILFSQEAA